MLAFLLTKSQRGHNMVRTKNCTAPWLTNKWWHLCKQCASMMVTMTRRRSSPKKMRKLYFAMTDETPAAAT
jgi:hypothetical protein